MNKTILIIDDDDILRTTLAHGLQAENFHTITADSAEMGLDLLSRITPDAIVLDRMMTGMDGLSLLLQLRNAGNNTPIIMLTAMSDTENIIDGLSGGANDYLAKPFQIRELILRLHNIIKARAPNSDTQYPAGISIINDDYFIISADNNKTLLTLSGEEKKLLSGLITPLGNIVAAPPMVAKRLRSKLNIVSSGLDIVTIRGHGYRLVETNERTNNTNGE